MYNNLEKNIPRINEWKNWKLNNFSKEEETNFKIEKQIEKENISHKNHKCKMFDKKKVNLYVVIVISTDRAK
jgi:hypothetical protein